MESESAPASQPAEAAAEAVEGALTSPDVLAGVMAALGLRHANLAASVSTAWRHAALALQEEQRVLRPSHSLGWGNEALGQFRSPSGIIALPSGELCVADTNNHRLQVLSRSGDVRCVVGAGPGGSMGEFQQPTGLACDGTALYVADSGNCRLHKLSLPRGESLMTIGSFGDQPGLLHAPVGLALYEGRLYCADSRNHRIAVFETQPALRFVRNFCTHGSALGELGTTSSGIYLAAHAGELYVADRSNHRLQVFTIDGAFARSIGSRGTAPGCFRRLRGVAVNAGMIFTAECERVQVLTLRGSPLQVLPLVGSSALVGICADSSHVCVVDQTHQKVRVLSVIRAEGRAASTAAGSPLGDSASAEPHLRPFLLPTATCDSDHPTIAALARRLVPNGCSAARGAATVRSWVRVNVGYALHPEGQPLASATLASCAGSALNKTSLQVALLRAAGIPAGFVVANVAREAFGGPHILPEAQRHLPPATAHYFCAAYVPHVPPPPPPEGTALPYGPSGPSAQGAGAELGGFRHFDATERHGLSAFTEYLPFSDETRCRAHWMRGPLSPVQANLDHVTPDELAERHIPAETVALQNKIYREHHHEMR